VKFVGALLPVSAFLFLIPFNPNLSTYCIISWLVLQLFCTSIPLRYVTWPVLFLLFLSSRAFLLNEMTHPVALEDAILLLASILAGACVEPGMWRTLLKLPLVTLFPLLFQLGDSPLLSDPLIRIGRHWTPNYLVGVNQGAYLLGIFLLISLAWLSVNFHLGRRIVFPSITTGLSLFMLVQTGSRAALLSTFIASIVVLLIYTPNFFQKCKTIIIAIASVVILLGVKQFFRPSTAGLPGVSPISDTGRLAIAKCYSLIPFSGNNRFLFGVGNGRID